MLACVTVSSLMIHGRDDLVLSSDVVDTYRQQIPGGSVHTFPESGHFAYHEEPDAHSGVVARFVLQHAN